MAVEDPLLAPLERWANASGEDGEYAPPKNVAEYYRRVAVAAAALALPAVDPLTGMRVSGLSGLLHQQFSCVEALRLPIVRDGFLWRRDIGGSILQVEPASDLGAHAIGRRDRGVPELPEFTVARGGGQLVMLFGRERLHRAVRTDEPNRRQPGRHGQRL